MGRTNIVIDDKLVAKVMKLWNLSTKREAVDFALRMAVARSDRLKVLELQGSIPDFDIREIRPGYQSPDEK